MDFKERRKFLAGEIKPEFGNLEQIQVLTAAEQRAEKLKKGMELDVEGIDDEEVDQGGDYLVTAQFICVCGCNVLFQNYSSNPQTNEGCLSDKRESCWNCKREYETYLQPYHSLYVILVQ